ncbi:MAG: hypothetical protein PHH60_02260 [Candidatus Margulisbacteria bacterium]|nr:hypothetical protein [Candidatus Margulisiibacteriota bacterium]
MITKEEAQELIKLEGQARGVAFQVDAHYVEKKWGKEGLAKLESRLVDVGCPIDYNKINSFTWYPIGLRMLSLRMISEVFDLDDQKIKDIGYQAPQISFFIKMLARFSPTIRSTLEKGTELWKRHYSRGRIEAKYDEPGKSILIRLIDFPLPEIGCFYLEGFLQRLLEFAVGRKVKAELIKAFYRGDPDTEFRFWWEA